MRNVSYGAFVDCFFDCDLDAGAGWKWFRNWVGFILEQTACETTIITKGFWKHGDREDAFI